jgi:hypothetical protein
MFKLYYKLSSSHAHASDSRVFLKIHGASGRPGRENTGNGNLAVEFTSDFQIVETERITLYRQARRTACRFKISNQFFHSDINTKYKKNKSL